MAAVTDDDIVWYADDGGGAFGPEQTVAAPVNSPRSVHAADLDGDADTDVLSASRHRVTWYENLGASLDGDGDELTAAAEQCIVGTDPQVWDTDGGGTNDRQELFDLTDPLDPADDIP